MKRKGPVLIVIAAVFILAMIGFNYSVVRPGVKVFSIRRYDSPRQAFQTLVPGEAVPVERELGTVQIDRNNVVAVFSTEGGGVAIAQLWEKGGKYFYIGTFRLLTAQALKTEEPETVSSFTYGEDGKCTGTLIYRLCLEKDAQDSFEAQAFYGGGPEGTVYLQWQKLEKQ